MFVQFYRCRDVLVEGITLRNTPMWAIHPVFCRAVTVRRVQVISQGPNNDGCVPDSSRDVLIEDCLFDTGDDCLAIKAGRNHDGWRVNVPAEDIVIRGCRMRGGHSAVAIGSEISGQIRRIFVERCTLDGAQLDHVVRIKANSTRGGVVEQVYLRDIAASRACEAAVRIDLHYDEAVEQGDRWPQVREVVIERLGCEHSERAVWIEGLVPAPVRVVRISDSVFRRVDATNILREVEGFSAPRTDFPAAFRGAH
jgi:polygalacturonase